MTQTVIWGSKSINVNQNSRRYLGLGFHANRSGATNTFSSTYRIPQSSARICEVYLSWQPRTTDTQSMSFVLLLQRPGDAEPSEVLRQEVTFSSSLPTSYEVRELAIPVRAGDTLTAMIDVGPVALTSSPFYPCLQAVLR